MTCRDAKAERDEAIETFKMCPRQFCFPQRRTRFYYIAVRKAVGLRALADTSECLGELMTGPLPLESFLAPSDSDTDDENPPSKKQRTERNPEDSKWPAKHAKAFEKAGLDFTIPPEPTEEEKAAFGQTGVLPARERSLLEYVQKTKGFPNVDGPEITCDVSQKRFMATRAVMPRKTKVAIE